MSTTLKSIPATVSPDGAVILSEPLHLSAMVTIVCEEEDALSDWN